MLGNIYYIRLVLVPSWKYLVKHNSREGEEGNFCQNSLTNEYPELIQTNTKIYYSSRSISLNGQTIERSNENKCSSY